MHLRVVDRSAGPELPNPLSPHSLPPGPNTTRPSVLVLANRLPFPVDDGWKTRTYHVIRGLAERGNVTLLVFHGEGREVVEDFRASLGDRIQVITVPTPRAHSPARLLLGLLTRTPVYIWNMRSRTFRHALRRLTATRQFDVVVSQLTYMYPYLRELPASTLRVVDTHNVDSVVLRRYAGKLRNVLRRWYAGMTARKLRRHEARVFADADLVWICSDQEAPVVREIAPSANVQVVPNGVDTTALAPMDHIEPRSGRLIFFGKMDYEPNRDALEFFAESILPRLLRKVPELELHVIGSGIGPELRALARRQPALRLIGRVDDIRPVLAEAEVVVVPLRMGGGTRLKILEALSLGKPLVSTTIGAEGLDLVSGRDLLLADSPDEFADAVLSMLRDEQLRLRLGHNGRATMQRLYDWHRVEEQMAAGLGWEAPIGDETETRRRAPA